MSQQASSKASGPLSRRSFLSSVAAPLGASVMARAQAQSSPKTNVILIMADDLGYECLECNGGTSYRTPNLNKMAANGVRFTHGYAQPLCTPTRVQLMTGQHNFRNWQSFGTMAQTEKTFGHMMQQTGYKTAMVGKWQFYSYESEPSPRRATGMKPEQAGFDEWVLWHDLYTETKGSRYADPVISDNGKIRTDLKGKYGPDIFVERINRFVETNKDRPFFVYYPMTLTHGPFNPTPRSADWAKGDRLKDDPKYYADMVAYMDECVGRVLSNVERLGLAERTLVLFYGDNGTPKEVTSKMGAKVIPGGKGLTTDAGMHVPLIASWKGRAPSGKVCPDLIDSTDFIPTIMEATGAKWFDGRPLDGRSFLPQVQGKKGNPRQWAFAHYDPHPGCKVNFPGTRLTWDQRWKLYMDGRLFDVQNDYFEKSPIPAGGGSAEAKAARAKLQAGLDRMAKVKPPKFNKFATDGRAAY